MSQPPTPPGSPGQPIPQPQPQPWPQQGMQPSADRGVDADGPATDAASMPTAGGSPGWTPPPWSPEAAAGDIPGWTPPPWSPDAADTRKFVRARAWAEWAVSTTFSSTGLMSGYDKQEVDAFRRAVRDTFLGVRKRPVSRKESRSQSRAPARART
jgi:hypothetical protein